jgi:ankyrin repeat domain-containing protein 50
MVIDALDECPEHERYQVIGFITKIVETLPCAKVFVTSRRESDILHAFEGGNTPTIQIKAENIAADIGLYVHSEVKKLRKGYYGKKLSLDSGTLGGKVIMTLKEKAEGMYVIAFKRRTISAC